MKKLKSILITIIIAYLIISALYVFFHINFSGNHQSVGIVGMGFSPINNALRLFMGLPKTYTTYEGV